MQELGETNNDLITPMSAPWMDYGSEGMMVALQSSSALDTLGPPSSPPPSAAPPPLPSPDPLPPPPSVVADTCLEEIFLEDNEVFGSSSSSSHRRRGRKTPKTTGDEDDDEYIPYHFLEDNEVFGSSSSSGHRRRGFKTARTAQEEEEDEEEDDDDYIPFFFDEKEVFGSSSSSGHRRIAWKPQPDEDDEDDDYVPLYLKKKDFMEEPEGAQAGASSSESQLVCHPCNSTEEAMLTSQRSTALLRSTKRAEGSASSSHGRIHGGNLNGEPASTTSDTILQGSGQIPRYPDRGAFPLARTLIEDFLQQYAEAWLRALDPQLFVPYRHLRVLLLELGFGLRGLPTVAEPTLNLCPLCKDPELAEVTMRELFPNLGEGTSSGVTTSAGTSSSSSSATPQSPQASEAPSLASRVVRNVMVAAELQVKCWPRHKFWHRPESESSETSSDEGEAGDQAARALVPAKKLPGLDDTSIDEYVVSFILLEAGDPAWGERCTFCLDEMSFGEELTRLPCFHVFHRQCVYAWLGRDQRCMICRHDVSQEHQHHHSLH